MLVISLSNVTYKEWFSWLEEKPNLSPPIRQACGCHAQELYCLGLKMVSNRFFPRPPFPENFQPMLQAGFNGPNALRVALYDEQVIPHGRVLQVG